MAALATFQIGATVEDLGHRHRLLFDDTHLYRAYVNSKGVGERVVVTFEDEGEKRSSAANRFLWGAVYKAVEEDTGSPKDVTHAAMCERFLKKQVFYLDKHTGLTVETWIVGGSSGLTPKAFHEFVQNVILYFAEHHGITVQDAEDYTRERGEVMKQRRGHAA